MSEESASSPATDKQSIISNTGLVRKPRPKGKEKLYALGWKSVVFNNY